MQALARLLLRLRGWSLELEPPGTRRYVLIVAPHTSNWDFPIGLLAAWALDLRAHWMGKNTLFEGLLGPLFRAWGGIPVNRGQPGKTIEKMASRFAASDDFVLGMAPEGTRGATDHWKSGFWHIARAARVPVVMAYIDYGRKQVGIGGAFMPGDDLETDFRRLRDFYADKRGRRPQQESVIRPRKD
ncbi:MAG TPA: lysophospholipid acyltransferase family protein [Wenzhouxiangellaceae bacterium]|nr:lysophospholipid acyltransferase family protein [Wenzhouxiangellaceae bacterium]